VKRVSRNHSAILSRSREGDKVLQQVCMGRGAGERLCRADTEGGGRPL
jgi:hypothetical protein